ncbi:hypothetical protein BKM88_02920 [Anaplasma marginale]|nr:hypothetical protein CQZ76_02925 [Anaplasma marginale]AXW85063.1 hypothetical protein BKM88_02920 [Anaplasma marginale]
MFVGRAYFQRGAAGEARFFVRYASGSSVMDDNAKLGIDIDCGPQMGACCAIHERNLCRHRIG